ncbi:unnamed protein product [Pieris macdunnoughi]|uniref:Uncharacterized protein n=1 Tax=Pieris macdunnoughi TaxID=345717 RepID=A0A821WEC0_9NEOP|nr:unnamed protein product [Pieris macdunnoughi]
MNKLYQEQLTEMEFERTEEKYRSIKEKLSQAYKDIIIETPKASTSASESEEQERLEDKNRLSHHKGLISML